MTRVQYSSGVRNRFRLPAGPIAYACDIMGVASIAAAGFYIALWLGLLITGLGLIAMGWVVERVASRGDQ